MFFGVGHIRNPNPEGSRCLHHLVEGRMGVNAGISICERMGVNWSYILHMSSDDWLDLWLMISDLTLESSRQNLRQSSHFLESGFCQITLKYFPLEWTLSFITLQIFFFMLKQLNYTLTKDEKVKKHNRKVEILVLENR